MRLFDIVKQDNMKNSFSLTSTNLGETNLQSEDVEVQHFNKPSNEIFCSKLLSLILSGGASGEVTEAATHLLFLPFSS